MLMLIPPTNGDITEEDSGNEAEDDMNRFTPRVIRSKVDVDFVSNENIFQEHHKYVLIMHKKKTMQCKKIVT